MSWTNLRKKEGEKDDASQKISGQFLLKHTLLVVHYTRALNLGMRTKSFLLEARQQQTWPKISHHKVTISNDGFEIEFARSFFPDPLVILVQILDG